MSAGKKIAIIILLALMLAGLTVALYPVVQNMIWKYETAETTEAFTQRTHILQAEIAPALNTEKEELEETDIPHSRLLNDMQVYNENLYQTNQSKLTSRTAYETAAFDLADYGVEDGIIGVLSVPSVGIEMPLYLGATDVNMAKGAVVLGETSVPIGGDNTNCVIAGHCGWRNADYFRYLTNISVGDTVTATNLWETLDYTVVSTQIVEPDDIDAILIHTGKDMLTLLTCYPYGSGGRYRFLVFCERCT